MSEKVVLPKEVAEAIDFLKNECNCTNLSVVHCAADALETGMGSIQGRLISDWLKRNINNQTVFLKALADGYAIEKTRTEKVREYYYCLKPAQGFAVKRAFELYGVKIPGIHMVKDGDAS